MAKRTYKSKSQIRRQGYNPKRTVNSTFARETRKNAEALGITASGIQSPRSAIFKMLGAGLEPKHKPVSRKTVSRGGRGGRGGGVSGAMWGKKPQDVVIRTIKGRKVPLGRGK